MVVGKDIAGNQILDLSRHTLVGNFINKRVGMDCLLRWIEDNWDLRLGYTSTTHLLARGWLGFVFRKEEDVVSILKENPSNLSLMPGKRPCQALQCG